MKASTWTTSWLSNKKRGNQEIHSDQHVRRCNLHSTNIRAALNGYPVLLHCWLDPTVALYCIKGQGARVSSICIQQRAQDPRTPCRIWSGITCQQPTSPDLGSRRGSAKDHQLWCQGPMCLSKWPQELGPRTSPETKAGTKVMRSILAAGSQGSCVVTTSTSNFKLISWTTYYGSDRGYRDSFEIFKFQTQVKKHGQSTVGRDGKQHELRINRTNCESNFRSNFCGNNTL